MHMTENDEVITEEAARILGVTPSTVSRMVARRTLTPSRKAPGLRGAMWFRRADVETVAASR
jgi:DNA-binding transcriptional regulator YdaS (Cro superfamily)